MIHFSYPSPGIATRRTLRSAALAGHVVPLRIKLRERHVVPVDVVPAHRKRGDQV